MIGLPYTEENMTISYRKW